MANILPSPQLFGLTSGRLIVATGAASVGNSNFIVSGSTLTVPAGGTIDSTGSLSIGTSATGINIATGSVAAPIAIGGTSNVTTYTNRAVSHTYIGTSAVANTSFWLYDQSTAATGGGSVFIVRSAGVNLFFVDSNGTPFFGKPANGNTTSAQIRAAGILLPAAAVDTASAGLNITGGAGGAASSIGAGNGGVTTVIGGIGGAGSGSFVGATGGLMQAVGGQGGPGTATAIAGAGGTALLQGGAGGVNNGGGGNNGGPVFIRGGPASGSGTNGTITIGDIQTSTINMGSAASTFNMLNGANKITQPVINGLGNNSALKISAGAFTSSLASAEINGFWYAARSLQWAAGTIGTQREALFEAPTYSFVSSSIINVAATLAVSGPPIAGANATLGQSFAFFIQSGSMAITGGSNAGIYNPNQAATNTTAMTLAPNVADGATSVALKINNGTGFATAGAKLLTVQNNGTEFFSVGYNLAGTASNFGTVLITGNTDSAALGPLVIANTAGGTIGTSVTMDATAGGGAKYSFISTGSGAGVGANCFAVFRAGFGYVFLADASGNFLPGSDVTMALGSSAKRWSNTTGVDFTSRSDPATSGGPTRNSGFMHFLGAGWNGTTSVDYDITLSNQVYSASPAQGRLQVQLGGADRLSVVDVGGGLGAVYFGPFASNDYIFGGNNSITVRAGSVTYASFASTNSQINSNSGSGVISTNDSAGSAIGYVSNNLTVDSTNATINIGGGGTFQIFGNAGSSMLIKVRQVAGGIHPLAVFQDSSQNTRFGMDSQGLPTLGALFDWKDDFRWMAVQSPVTAAGSTNFASGSVGWAAIITTGTGTSIGPASGALGTYPSPNYVQINSGTSTSNSVSFAANPWIYDLAALTSLVAVIEWDMALSDASTSNLANFWAGMGVTLLNGAASNGVYFRKLSGTANWEAVSNDGTTTNATTTVAVNPANNTMSRFRIEWYGSASPLAAKTAKYYVDGTLVATHTTNLPTGKVSWVFQTIPTSTVNKAMYVANVRTWSNLYTTPLTP